MKIQNETLESETSGFDRTIAVIFIILMCPFILFRSAVALVRTGSAFENVEINNGGRIFTLYRFSGFSRGRKIPYLFNIVRGDLVFVGVGRLIANVVADRRESETSELGRYQPRPCLITLQKVRNRSGTDYGENELSTISVKDKISILARYALIEMLVPEKSYYRPDRFAMMGVMTDNLTLDTAVEKMIENARNRVKMRCAFVNADCLNIAYKHEKYMNALKHKTLVFADGIGLQIGAQMLGVDLRGNVNGTDLLPKLCKQAVGNSLSIYLLGGKPGVAEEAGHNLKKNHAGLCIAGHQHGYFSKNEEDEVIAAINESNADIVLVAFGAPHQDIWIEDNADRLDASVLVGVGGLLDFQTTRISRSPKWVQDIGLEWVWRLKQEPMRLWRRYLIGNPLFLYRVNRQVRTDEKCVNYRRFKNPHRAAAAPNKRYQRQQYLWLLKFQFTRIGKRLIDIAASAVALIVLSPLLLFVVLLIKLESPGAVLFQQNRVGRYGKSFSMLKFRSMRVDAEQEMTDLSTDNEVAGGVTFKMKKDPRVTRVGKYIRKYSIDELPQLINVIRGDMSLVGPRPSLPSEVNLYTRRDRRRLEVIPGMTGLWQVSGRSDTTFAEQVELDIDYLESRGLIGDAIILLKTLPAVLSGRGAY